LGAQFDNTMAIEDLPRAMGCEIPTGSTVDSYSDSAVFEILLISDSTRMDSLRD
jgi:hypothetical protein